MFLFCFVFILYFSIKRNRDVKKIQIQRAQEANSCLEDKRMETNNVISNISIKITDGKEASEKSLDFNIFRSSFSSRETSTMSLRTDKLVT